MNRERCFSWREKNQRGDRLARKYSNHEIGFERGVRQRGVGIAREMSSNCKRDFKRRERRGERTERIEELTCVQLNFDGMYDVVAPIYLSPLNVVYRCLFTLLSELALYL